jgi:carbamoyltransferase
MHHNSPTIVVMNSSNEVLGAPNMIGRLDTFGGTDTEDVNDWLNKRLKRTEFMPFAPVTLEPFADECYENLDGVRHPAQFMTVTVNCTERMRKDCPAVVHVDGTARPQIINQRTNPSYFKILAEYRKLTGLPSLINTSFNMHEEPIVCSPSDALRAFLDGGLDYLAMGNYLLEHPTRIPSSQPGDHRAATWVSSF